MVISFFLTSDEMFFDLGYKKIEEVETGVRYEKELPDGRIKVITIEMTDAPDPRHDGDLVVYSCDKEGLHGKGHLALGLTFGETKACMRKMREIRDRIQ